MTTNLIKRLLIAAALIASASVHADNTIRVSVENGKQHAAFTLAGAHCVLVDDQIRCSPRVVVADNDR
jgi:hypothetical protein